jgi:hypothetical protein
MKSIVCSTKEIFHQLLLSVSRRSSDMSESLPLANWIPCNQPCLSIANNNMTLSWPHQIIWKSCHAKPSVPFQNSSCQRWDELGDPVHPQHGLLHFSVSTSHELTPVGVTPNQRSIYPLIILNVILGNRLVGDDPKSLISFPLWNSPIQSHVVPVLWHDIFDPNERWRMCLTFAP